LAFLINLCYVIFCEVVIAIFKIVIIATAAKVAMVIVTIFINVIFADAALVDVISAEITFADAISAESA